MVLNQSKEMLHNRVEKHMQQQSCQREKVEYSLDTVQGKIRCGMPASLAFAVTCARLSLDHHHDSDGGQNRLV